MTLKFYQNLGKLFYAVAAVDLEVNEAEVKKLKEVVKKYWLDVDATEDAFGSDAAYQIEIVFDWLNATGNTADSKSYFDDFVAYKNEQSHLFTEKIKTLTMKTASKIAESFAGKNKSELMLLAKLNLELKKPV